eukprot:TRINITY_DN45700_c0_g1_i2.p1 TRINITY_DN45700_c0_g1~~TRINITY_DN45700_c0_g1_i2.p1  ORF type:complete len:801 (+),score=49.36 TRINITY_DN45700_c0_g1_i2:51-2453(+)
MILNMQSMLVTVLAMALFHYGCRAINNLLQLWRCCPQETAEVLKSSTKTCFEARVEEGVMDMRERRVRLMCRFGEPAIMAVACVRLWCYMRQGEIVSEQANGLFMLACVRLIVCMLFFLIMAHVSGSYTEYCIAGLSWLIFGGQLIVSWMVQESIVVGMNEQIHFVLRCISALFLGDVRTAIIQNSLLSMVRCCAYSFAVQMKPSSLAPPDLFYQQECVAAFFIVCMTWVAEKSFDAEVRARLSEQEARNGKATADSMLSAACDAVVHLDADMTISEPAPKVAAMLCDPSARLEGQAFSELLVPEDASRFRSICEAAQRDKHTQAMNVSLIDASSALLQAQLLVTGYKDVYDRIGYAVGVSEGTRSNREASCKPSSSSEDSTIASRDADVRDAFGSCKASTYNKTHSLMESIIDETCPSDVSFAHKQRRNDMSSSLASECSDDEAQSVLGSETCPSDVSTAFTINRHSNSKHMKRKLQGSSLAPSGLHPSLDLKLAEEIPSKTESPLVQFSSVDFPYTQGVDRKDPLNESDSRSVFPLHESDVPTVQWSKAGALEDNAHLAYQTRVAPDTSVAWELERSNFRSRRLVDLQALSTLSETCRTPDLCAQTIRDASSESYSTDESAQECEDSCSALPVKGSLQENFCQHPAFSSFSNELMAELDRNRQSFHEDSEENSFDLCFDFERQAIDERSHVRRSRHPVRALIRSSAVDVNRETVSTCDIRSETSSVDSVDLCGYRSMDFSFQNKLTIGSGRQSQPKEARDSDVPFWMMSEDALEQLERNRERFCDSSDACSVSSLFED